MGAPAEYKVRFYENGKDLIIVSRLVGSLQCLAGYYHIKDGHLLGYKGWLPSAKLKPTFTFLGRDFAIFNTFSWQNPYQEK